jgi:uncharacterized RDD family membrane protein YckC
MRHRTGDRDMPGHGLFSPEGVHLDLPIAGPAPRMFAYAIDLAAVIVLIILLIIILGTLLPVAAWLERWFGSLFREVGAGAKSPQAKQSFDRVTGLMIAFFVLAQFAVETGYFIFWEMVTNGRSPGKAAVGLRVVRRDGLPIDARSSAVRNLMRIVDILPANYVVGLVSTIVSNSGERIGDHAAGTLVVRLDRPEAAPDLAVSGAPSSSAFTRQQMARIGPRELQLMRGTLRRVTELPENRAHELLTEVAESMRIRMGLAELPSSDRAAFLRSILSMAERYSSNASR